MSPILSKIKNKVSQSGETLTNVKLIEEEAKKTLIHIKPSKGPTKMLKSKRSFSTN
jgi:hypothetical protein